MKSTSKPTGIRAILISVIVASIASSIGVEPASKRSSVDVNRISIVYEPFSSARDPVLLVAGSGMQLTGRPIGTLPHFPTHSMIWPKDAVVLVDTLAMK
jgi:hypothetical protein